jgi:hypothetical protein
MEGVEEVEFATLEWVAWYYARPTMDDRAELARQSRGCRSNPRQLTGRKHRRKGVRSFSSGPLADDLADLENRG